MAKTSPRTPSLDPTTRCSCGSGATFGECCQRLHAGTAQAATAEQLMRSRFSAHAVGDESYLLRSWDPSTRPQHITFDPSVRWTRLEILGTTKGNLLDTTGTVEFVAHYDQAGAAHTHHENSRFVRNEGHWVYLSD